MVWERRWHPLREEWVTVTSHRNSRPWSGSEISQVVTEQPAFDPDCYLCPGNTRVSGIANDSYKDVFVFDNDHPAFSLKAPTGLEASPGFYSSAPATGITRVVCYTPAHNLSLAELEESAIQNLFDCWARQTEELTSRPEIDHVFVFENKGEIIGVSNPHPHCQIYATSFVLKATETEVNAIRKYHEEHEKSLFREIINNELNDGRRLIAENEDALAFVPYFARFPYETYVVPKKTHQFIFELSGTERMALVQALKTVLVKFDNLWQMSFPYVLTLHQAPCDGAQYPQYHFHIQIHPPLRQPGLQKFLAGAELGGDTYLNDACPEETALELQAQPDVHYKEAG